MNNLDTQHAVLDQLQKVNNFNEKQLLEIQMISDYRFEYQISPNLSGDVQSIFAGKNDVPQLQTF